MVVKIQCNVIGDNTQHDDWHIKRLTFISLLCNGANILDPKKKKKRSIRSYTFTLGTTKQTLREHLFSPALSETPWLGHCNGFPALQKILRQIRTFSSKGTG